MRPDPTRTYAPYRVIAHRITLSQNQILRDGTPVKITRLDEQTVKVGCTTVTIEALRKLLQLVSDSDVLQEGAE